MGLGENHLSFESSLLSSDFMSANINASFGKNKLYCFPKAFRLLDNSVTHRINQ